MPSVKRNNTRRRKWFFCPFLQKFSKSEEKFYCESFLANLKLLLMGIRTKFGVLTILLIFLNLLLMKWTQKKDFTDPICFFKFIVEEMDSKNVFLLILFVFLNLLLINWSQKMCFCWSYLFFKIYCWSFWTSKMYFWWSYISIYNSKFTLTCQNSQKKTVNLNKICKSTMTPNASKLTTELSIFFLKRKSKENQPQNNQQN